MLPPRSASDPYSTVLALILQLWTALPSPPPARETTTLGVWSVVFRVSEAEESAERAQAEADALVAAEAARAAIYPVTAYTQA